VFAPDGRRAWARAYAIPPTPHVLGDGLLRVYAAFCDEHTVGRVGYVDVRLDRPSEIVRVSARPVLDVGEPGAFDDNGVVPTCVVPVGDELYLYYTGYRLEADVPYSQLLGLAISRDGGESFERHSSVPVLEPSDGERTTRASAHVVRDGAGFTMYYSGGSGWVDHAGRRLPVYTIRRLESPDGFAWGPAGRVCIDLASEDEHAIARPWLLPPVAGRQRMLYSYRALSHDYRIGLAVSGDDGLTWERRDDEAGIAPSGQGWDSDAVAYGATVRHGATTYLLYCGNDRGRTGFGYAELDPRG
jgi:predicted GH43/DUF377 family glycosyl hydrolase